MSDQLGIVGVALADQVNAIGIGNVSDAVISISPIVLHNTMPQRIAETESCGFPDGAIDAVRLVLGPGSEVTP